MKILKILIALFAFNVCLADYKEKTVTEKIDGLIAQLNDGCSSEVTEARRLFQFSDGVRKLYVALVSIEGQHCGNGNYQYLIVYQNAYSKPENEEDTAKQTQSLVDFLIIGGRGKRTVDFDSLKYSNGIFTLSAKENLNDPMCCPSHPVTLKYKLTYYGLTEQ